MLAGVDLVKFWKALTPIVETALDAAEPAMRSPRPHDDESTTDALEILHATTVLAHACIADPERKAPDELIDVAASLHDIIFDLVDPSASDLQAAIVDLCEAWWLSERDGRDELVPQCVSYMLVRALHDMATTADIKRLYAFRSSLTVLDYADESVGPLKRLLLHCAIRPLILRCAEGRKLVAYFFSLHVPFIAELHRAIKSQIPACRKQQREAYGEVYFRAWRNSTGPYQSKMEEDCLQDLMFHGLHASSTGMISAIRQVLAFTNDQKRQRGVDAMLLQLWGPILWRALQVANPNVRKNAATLFIEAFPLADPTMPAVELDQQMQMQFDTLTKILKDDNVGVRVVASHGVCRILTLYWDLILSATTKGLLTTLIKDLAHDAAANTVRVAVLQGLKYLLCRMARPRSSPRSRESSGRYRASSTTALSAFVRRYWTFYSLAPSAVPSRGSRSSPDDLLARLPLERPDMQMRLTRLLLPIYLPSGKPDQQARHATRFLQLTGSGTPACRALLYTRRALPPLPRSSACFAYISARS